MSFKKERGTPFPVLNINMTLMRDTIDEIDSVLDLAERWGVAVLVAWTMLTSGVVFWIVRWKLMLKTGEAEDQPEDRPD